MMRLTTTLSLSSLMFSLLVARVASAQTTDAPAEPSDTTATAPGEPTAAPAATADDSAPTKADKSKEELVDEAQMGDSAAELPGKTYYFVGLRYRGIIMPKFMENLFAVGGTTVYVNAVGPEFGIRKNGFEYSLSPWLAFYNMGDTPFRGKNDVDTAYEIVSSKIQILYLTSDFLWSHEFTPEFALNYGLGAGLGFVFGNLYRTQAYPPNGQSSDPSTYQKCAGRGQPDVAYCGDDNDHYNGFKEPSWANDGSKPIVFPWLTLQTGIRIKPSKSVALRLDLGFGTSGFFFGVGGDYGL